MLAGTILQIYQRIAEVDITTRIMVDLGLIVTGAAALAGSAGRDLGQFLFGAFLVVTGVVAMSEGALLNLVMMVVPSSWLTWA